jgi:hypothetical protein
MGRFDDLTSDERDLLLKVLADHLEASSPDDLAQELLDESRLAGRCYLAQRYRRPANELATDQPQNLQKNLGLNQTYTATTNAEASRASTRWDASVLSWAARRTICLALTSKQQARHLTRK